jgi:hypothetical protein
MAEPTGNFGHDAAVAKAEAARQVTISAIVPNSTFVVGGPTGPTPALLQQAAAARSAEIVYARSCLASALATNGVVSPVPFITKLMELGTGGQ